MPCLFSQGRMLVRSKMVPVAVQTGWEKGWRERAQKLKGRRLKDAPVLVDLRALAPAAEEKASVEDHSLWVIWRTSG